MSEDEKLSGAIRHNGAEYKFIDLWWEDETTLVFVLEGGKEYIKATGVKLTNFEFPKFAGEEITGASVTLKVSGGDVE